MDGSLSIFADGAETSGWARMAMIWAVEQELITGVGNGRLEPGGQATRAQAATILMRYVKMRKNNGFPGQLDRRIQAGPGNRKRTESGTANRYKLLIETYTIPRIGNVKRKKRTTRHLYRP